MWILATNVRMFTPEILVLLPKFSCDLRLILYRLPYEHVLRDREDTRSPMSFPLPKSLLLVACFTIVASPRGEQLYPQ